MKKKQNKHLRKRKMSIKKIPFCFLNRKRYILGVKLFFNVKFYIFAV